MRAACALCRSFYRWNLHGEYYISTEGPDPEEVSDDNDPYQSFLRAFVSDDGNETEYWPGGGVDFAHLGILPEQNAQEGLYNNASCFVNVGNGALTGFFSAPTGPLSLTMAGGSAGWRDGTPDTGKTVYDAVVYSPSGTSAGYLFDPNSGSSNSAVCVGGVPEVTSHLYPLAVSDNGLVLGREINPTDDNDTVLVTDTQGALARLSSLVPDQFRGKVRFPGWNNAAFHRTSAAQLGQPYAWINNNGDVYVHAQCQDTSDPSGKTWVDRSLIWQNALGLDTTKPSTMAVAEFPDNYEQEQQFNNNGVFVTTVGAAATDQAPAHDAAGVMFQAKFESAHYDRGFDPPVKGYRSDVDHDDYRTSVGINTDEFGDDPTEFPYIADLNPYLPIDITDRNLSLNNHISVIFASDNVASLCDVVVKNDSANLIDLRQEGAHTRSNKLDITGLNNGRATIVIYPKGNYNSQPLATLTVDVMPIIRRSLGIWNISDVSGPLPNFQGIPDSQILDILHEANKAFRQACIIYTPIDPNHAPATNLLDVKYDKAYETLLGGSFSPNGWLNIWAAEDPELSRPEPDAVNKAIGDACGQWIPDANLSIVPNIYVYPPPGGNPDGIALGWTYPDKKGLSHYSYLVAIPNQVEMKLAASHELGHQLGLSITNKSTDQHLSLIHISPRRNTALVRSPFTVRTARL